MWSPPQGPSIKQFMDIFSLPEMALLSCVVDHFLGHGLEFDQTHLYKDVTVRMLGLPLRWQEGEVQLQQGRLSRPPPCPHCVPSPQDAIRDVHVKGLMYQWIERDMGKVDAARAACWSRVAGPHTPIFPLREVHPAGGRDVRGPEPPGGPRETAVPHHQQSLQLCVSAAPLCGGGGPTAPPSASCSHDASAQGQGDAAHGGSRLAPAL